MLGLKIFVSAKALRAFAQLLPSRVPQLTCIWMSGASGLGKLTPHSQMLNIIIIIIIIIITTYSQVPRTRPRLYGHNRQLAPTRERPESARGDYRRCVVSRSHTWSGISDLTLT